MRDQNDFQTLPYLLNTLSPNITQLMDSGYSTNLVHLIQKYNACAEKLNKTDQVDIQYSYYSQCPTYWRTSYIHIMILKLCFWQCSFEL